MFGTYTAERASQFVAAKVMCFGVLARDMAQGPPPLAPPGCGCLILDAFIIVARSEHTRCFRHPGWLKRADDSFHFAEQPMPIRHSQS
jgi:hypothetical protein